MVGRDLVLQLTVATSAEAFHSKTRREEAVRWMEWMISRLRRTSLSYGQNTTAEPAASVKRRPLAGTWQILGG